MTHDQFVNLLHLRPFRPCRPRTASGHVIEVTHPEMIAYGGERTALVALPNDGWEILDIALVESINGTNEPAPDIDIGEEN